MDLTKISEGQKIWIFDLDGTLGDVRHRLHHILAGEKNWEAFFDECDKDAPIAPAIELLRTLAAAGDAIWIWTGRSVIVAKKTDAWLCRHDVPYDHLRMRPKDCRIPDADLKRAWYRSLTDEAQSLVRGVWEDRSRVCKMWREEGVPCYQVAEGNF